MTIRSVLGASIALVLVSCAAPSSQPRPESLTAESIGPQGRAPESVANDGREIAEAQCAACHAVGAYGESPNIAAPNFRTILSRYHADVLEEDLIAGIQVAHPMPAFQFNPQGVDALIAYLHSIQETPEPERRAAAPTTNGNAEEGRRLAEINCATCHAIGLTGESRHPMAPPFRTLPQYYPLNSLEEAFGEASSSAIPTCRSFSWSPRRWIICSLT